MDDRRSSRSNSTAGSLLWGQFNDGGRSVASDQRSQPIPSSEGELPSTGSQKRPRDESTLHATATSSTKGAEDTATASVKGGGEASGATQDNIFTSAMSAWRMGVKESDGTTPAASQLFGSKISSNETSSESYSDCEEEKDT
eukprot:Sspe_Gene.116610::Locus_106241_Transcript_1_3_Confidence_0.500_Length_482::g.116610::m.116610